MVKTVCVKWMKPYSEVTASPSLQLNAEQKKVKSSECLDVSSGLQLRAANIRKSFFEA